MMDEKEKIRIDKWLWAVRLFKTRNMAAEACKKGKILVHENNIKPSYIVKIGDEIHLKVPPIVRTFAVKGLIENRVSAKVAVEYVEETTPASELDKLKIAKTIMVAPRERGAGRPTKKERREIEKMIDEE
jgi:ribosome-associated heat shock protein Hsp15